MCCTSNADTPADHIIKVVLHDEATNQPEKASEVPRKHGEDKERPVFEVEDTREPEVAEGAQHLLQKPANGTVPALCQLNLSPLMHSSSLGSTVEYLFLCTLLFRNIPSTDPLSLNILIDQLQDKVGKLEAASERTLAKQLQMATEIERVVVDQHKLVWELDRIERQFQLLSRSSSWGPSVTHSAVYSDLH